WRWWHRRASASPASSCSSARAWPAPSSYETAASRRSSPRYRSFWRRGRWVREEAVVRTTASTTRSTRYVRQLAMQVRNLGSPRSITVLSGGSGQTGVSGLIVPAATVGALGYGYMWWKGISFGDLMYVTKQNMANVVSSMTKHLEQVQSSLAAAKKHLTQRIEKLDDKLDQQKALSGQIKDDVTGARLKLENIGSEIKNIKELVWGLDEKMDSMEAKQNFSCAGVMYLCQFIEQSGGKLPERLAMLHLYAAFCSLFMSCVCSYFLFKVYIWVVILAVYYHAVQDS
uniref:DUF1664 domain-containing protein n=2 Tax=Aegilops tauschii subsp. strangulata TaxID=200361 RepID=A0A452Y5F0_AEGTS